VTFVGNTLYALLAGAGCSHGLAETDNAVLRVNADNATTVVADLSAFIKTHPVQNPNADDFEPDGTWYSMVVVRGALFASCPAQRKPDGCPVSVGERRYGIDRSTRCLPAAGVVSLGIPFGSMGRSSTASASFTI
jgi:hypothetical protein